MFSNQYIAFPVINILHFQESIYFITNSTQIILLGKSALNVSLAIQNTYKMVEHEKSNKKAKYHHMHNKLPVINILHFL